MSIPDSKESYTLSREKIGKAGPFRIFKPVNESALTANDLITRTFISRMDLLKYTPHITPAMHAAINRKLDAARFPDTAGLKDPRVEEQRFFPIPGASFKPIRCLNLLQGALCLLFALEARGGNVLPESLCDIVEFMLGYFDYFYNGPGEFARQHFHYAVVIFLLVHGDSTRVESIVCPDCEKKDIRYNFWRCTGLLADGKTKCDARIHVGLQGCRPAVLAPKAAEDEYPKMAQSRTLSDPLVLYAMRLFFQDCSSWCGSCAPGYVSKEGQVVYSNQDPIPWVAPVSGDAETVRTMMNELCEVMSHASSWPFNLPVSPEEYPEYYRQISEPMDFFSVLNKLRAGELTDRVEFKRRMILVCENAQKFNQPGTWIYSYATNLRSLFGAIHDGTPYEVKRHHGRPPGSGRGRGGYRSSGAGRGGDGGDAGGAHDEEFDEHDASESGSDEDGDGGGSGGETGGSPRRGRKRRSAGDDGAGGGDESPGPDADTGDSSIVPVERKRGRGRPRRSGRMTEGRATEADGLDFSRLATEITVLHSLVTSVVDKMTALDEKLTAKLEEFTTNAQSEIQAAKDEIQSTRAIISSGHQRLVQALQGGSAADVLMD